MFVTPQTNGSLIIDQPDQKTIFDMGNRSLFLKTDGDGNLKQIFFARGTHAAKWTLELKINGEVVSFQRAHAIGRLWVLENQSELYSVSVSVFIDEKLPVVFQQIRINATANSSLKVDIGVMLDIIPVPAPVTKVKALAAAWIPRLPRFSHLWAKGWARRLREPSPHGLRSPDGQTLIATGNPHWSWTANHPNDSLHIRGKQALVHFSFTVADRQTKDLEFALAEQGSLTASAVLGKLPEAYQNARDYAAWLSSRIEIDDPLLQSLYVAGLNTSVSMYKEFPDGFKGLVAGPDYAFPPRIYFRDGYWAAQALIYAAPELVRAHLICISSGVHADGQCPSGIFAPHLLKKWKAPANCNSDWLADHYDSPSFFVLLLDDYLQATGDWQLLDEIPPDFFGNQNSATIWQRACAAINYMTSQDHDQDGLIEKPYQANDWTDNINRNVWVAYDQALYVAALRAMVKLTGHSPNPDHAQQYAALADAAWRAMCRQLWDSTQGYFVNYHRPGFTEDNLSLDSLVTLYYGLTDEEQTQSILKAAQSFLISRNNPRQPYGDFGTLCAFPLYQCQVDLFDKSALPYCYHNGADWPYLDGMYAAVLLRRHDPLGLEVLSRWWSYGLEQGWLTPVEYFSPAWPVGGMLQGWSSMPAAVLARELSTVKQLLNDKEVHHPHH